MPSQPDPTSTCACGVRRVVAVTAAVVAAAVVPLVSSNPAAASGFTCTSGAATYQVVSGDSWNAIAQRAGVSPADLLGANSAEVADAIHPGDVLCLPGGATPLTSCGGSYRVGRGDSWSSIASAAGVGLAALLTANDAPPSRAIHPGDEVCLPAGASISSSGGGSGASSAATGQSYRVVAGDSWWVIADRHGISPRALLDLNGATASTAIHPGDVLQLPAGATASKGGSATPVASGSTYTVRRGDSWYGIARDAGVSGRALMEVNGATARTVLLPGQAISLPAGANVSQLTQAAQQRAGVRLAAAPVQGPCWYSDTWRAYRSGGRRHEGVDMFSVKDQYIYAVVDGTLTTRHWDQPGKRSGNAWWLRGADGNSYFYAHMSGFANGLQEGSKVKAGQIIGFMGATGNAAGVHLHFEVHPGGGDAINAYPVVAAIGGCNTGTPYTQPGGWVPDRRS